jgi:hypothetical protein
MSIHILCPKEGWQDFPRSLEVGDIVYSRLMPLVNAGEMDYINFVSGSGVFENEYGLLLIDFLTPENNEDEIQFVKFLSVAVNKSGTSNVFKSLVENFKLEYGLVELDCSG